MKILGISAYYHDSAAALIINNKIICAVQEERFTRVKHDPNFPYYSIKYCLKSNGLSLNEIDYFVFYDKPFTKFERIFETYLHFAPRGFKSFYKSLPIWAKDKLFQKKLLIKELKEIDDKPDIKINLLFSNHHLSHASSAFFPSPFNNAAILTMDGVGEWSTTSISIGLKNDISVIKEINFPHSIGLLYSAFTYYLGFKVNSGEYKLMGLAPYGKPEYVNRIKDNLIDIKEDGSFKINIDYFDYCTGLKMTNNKFNKLFNNSYRHPEGKIKQIHMDIAASIQKVIEEIIIKIGYDIKKNTNQKNLCLAGGVALNCVANGKLLQEEIFQNIWIQPASGDAGGALGAALALNYMTFKNERFVDERNDSMQGSFLGPSFNYGEIKNGLDNIGANYQIYSQDEMILNTAKELASGKAVGWMQGKMEFGPRSLGSRSILADPRDPKMQKNLNLKVKYRESFRPFAPSIMLDCTNDWFDLDIESPYMLIVDQVKEEKLKYSNDNNLFGIDKLNMARSEIPAVTHVDNSARIQTVNKDINPLFYRLIKEFYKITNVPVLVNTSFNIRGEPIVCNINDAFRCFMGTDLDILVIDQFILRKDEQNKKLLKDYKNQFELD